MSFITLQLLPGNGSTWPHPGLLQIHSILCDDVGHLTGTNIQQRKISGSSKVTWLLTRNMIPWLGWFYSWHCHILSLPVFPAWKRDSQINRANWDRDTSLSKRCVVFEVLLCEAFDFHWLSMRKGKAVNVSISNLSWTVVWKIPCWPYSDINCRFLICCLFFHTILRPQIETSREKILMQAGNAAVGLPLWEGRRCLGVTGVITSKRAQ